MLGLAVAGLWPLLRNISMDSWAAIGLVKPAGQWPRLAAGFGLGFASLAGVALLAILGGARTVSEEFSASVLLSKITSAGLTAAIVSVLEELLFRGAIFGALRKAHRWTTALVLSSGIYSLVHFFQKPVSPEDVTWRSGLELLPRMLHGFVEVEMLVPGFFTLFLAGLILGLAYQRSRNLYLSIGLHAGWIFWLKFYGAVTTESAGANRWFWGSDKLIDGWLALAMLLPVLGAIWLWPMRKEPPSNVA